MPVFVEDPLSRIVKVHWKDRDDGGGGPPDFYYPCGAFRHGYGLGTFFGNLPGLSIFILADFNIYGIAYDDAPGASTSTKPFSYWWSTADYLPTDEATYPRDVPYIWGPQVNFTVSVDLDTMAARVPLWTGEVRIQEFRNLNIQRFKYEGPFPDRVVDSAVMDIGRHAPTEVYPPGFRVLIKTSDVPGMWRTVLYPPTLIQAHCEHETIGGYPPSPPGFPPGNYWYEYPAPGNSEEPLRPPPILL